MTEISDKLYDRSVIKQLHLKKGSRCLFQKNAYSASIIKRTPEFIETSSFLSFNDDIEIDISDLNKIRRQILCAGGELLFLNADILLSTNFDESKLRKISVSLKKVADKLSITIERVSVFVEERSNIGIIIRGIGKLKNSTVTPWQNQEIFRGQDIILTGYLGETEGNLLFKNEFEKLKKAFPKVFIERLKTEREDRLPFIEVEIAPFYAVTSMASCEKGLEATLWNLGDRNLVGLEIFEERLPYTQETIELAEYFNINPLEMYSEGAYILTSFRGEELVHALREKGLNAVSIGKVTEDKKRIIKFDNEERFIVTPVYH